MVKWVSPRRSKTAEESRARTRLSMGNSKEEVKIAFKFQMKEVREPSRVPVIGYIAQEIWQLEDKHRATESRELQAGQSL